MASHSIKSTIVGALVAAALSACGGGGGGGGNSNEIVVAGAPSASSVASTDLFVLQAAYAARIANGAMESFNLAGNCHGTATTTFAPAVASTFEGIAGRSVAQQSTVAYSDCLPSAGRSTGTTYYDANFVQIGLSVDGGEYAVKANGSTVTSLPAMVKVGDTGNLATLTTYRDSTKADVTGRRELSYVIEPETSTTVIANLINRSYDTLDRRLSTEQSRYRIGSTGAFTLLSIDVQFETTSGIRLVYTPTPK